MLDGRIGTGPGRVNVTGLARTVRALEAAGAEAQDMKSLMHRIGMIVVRAADPPVRTGRLADSLRAGRGRTKAVVRAGGARVPYAGIAHYVHPGTRFLVVALRETRPQVIRTLDDGLGQILRSTDLK